MRFKYDAHLSAIPDCPPSHYECKDIQAFRFVFKDLNHKNNFLPVSLMNPKRKFPDDASKCQGYGLSFFDTLENARRRYLAIKKNFRNIGKIIGTHIAEGFIEVNDGVVSEVNSSGHFCLHEFEHTDLSRKFHLVLKVYNNGTG